MLGRLRTPAQKIRLVSKAQSFVQAKHHSKNNPASSLQASTLHFHGLVTVRILTNERIQVALEVFLHSAHFGGVVEAGASSLADQADEICRDRFLGKIYKT